MKRTPPIAKGVIGLIKTQDKRIKKMENKQSSISPLKIKHKTLEHSMYLSLCLNPRKAIYKEKSPPGQSEEEGLKNYQTNGHRGISFFGGDSKTFEDLNLLIKALEALQS